MLQRLYCIYDFKAEAPVNGIFQAFSTDAQACRMFTDVVGGRGTIISDHPDDFGLLFIGEVNFDNLHVEHNMSSRFAPILTGTAVVRELERARSAKAVGDGANGNGAPSMSDREAVMRDQLSLVDGPRV